MRILKWLVMLALILIIAGCGQKAVHPSDLEKYANGLPDMKVVFDRFELRHLSSSSSPEGVYLEVRKRKPKTGMTEEEVERFKQAVFEEYGRKFPFEVKIWTLPEQPSIDGKITALREDAILAVAPKTESNASPRAIWMGVGEDTIIVNQKTGETLKTDDLAIGYRINAWGEMLTLDSYPEQTGLLRLEVLDMDAGEGDVQGKITKLVPAENDPWSREIHIDGEKYRLMENTRFVINDEHALFQDLKEGDEVQAWLAGYEIYPEEQLITQIVIKKR